MTEILERLPALASAHLRLSVLALAIGIGVGIPIGVAVLRRERLERAVLGAAAVIQTIPALALLAVMVPALAAAGVLLEGVGVEIRSIGFLPALLGLSLYSLLPILRNTVVGLRGIDPAVLEAADGVGMTTAERFRRVEWPLALPVVVAGVRTATVWVVGMATLSTPVGAPSLGDLIFAGLQTRTFASVLGGCVASAVLALALDGLVAFLESAVRRRRRASVLAAGAVFAALGLHALSGLVSGRAPEMVTIGAKTFTEQYILAEILARRVTEETGRPTRTLASLGSTVVFDALRSGEIDAYVDYTGTIWATILRREGRPPSRDRVLEEVREALERDHGVRVVAALGFENAYALAMRRSDAERRGIRTIADLAPHAPRLEIGGDYEFFSRPEWKALRDGYGLAFARERAMDPSLLYQAAGTGEVDVVSAYSTDGRIDAFDLVVLDDPRGAIPPYDAIILVRGGLDEEIVRSLATLDGTIDAAAMRRMNRAVDQDGVPPSRVSQR